MTLSIQPRHRRAHLHHLSILVGLLLLLAGCSSQQTRELDTDTVLANAVLSGAMNLVGTPYHYGGDTPETGFDCSGLAGYVYRTGAGISLPRTVRAMDAMDVPSVKREALQAGDLLIFATSGRQPDHAGIYAGQQRFVHAPGRGGTVRLDRLDDHYWQARFLHGKRLLRRRH